MGRNNFQIKLTQNNIIHNFNYIKKYTQKEIIAVVKANAYGHGLKEVVSILSSHGCNYFAVARESEAMEILSLNIPEIKILIFETVNDFSILKKYNNLEMVVNSFYELKELINAKVDFSQLHLKFDFGFARNGFSTDEINLVKETIIKNNLYFKGAMTHFFSSNIDESKKIQNYFLKSIEYIGKDYFSIIHSENSATTLLNIIDGSTHVRCGISILGMLDPGIIDENIKRSWSLSGPIYDIKDFSNLDFIGYERIENINTSNFSKVGKIKIGYGDGFSKRNTDILCHIRNKEYPIVHISMDTSFILIDDLVEIGDNVEIYQNFEKCNAFLKMDHYEYTTLLNSRIPRIIVK
ncbi:alanine racemase [Candidatus Cetobacterium colombiensis]|jgi:alanine racemase|uniref:Alanine racemase n=1 Tax=Candidatus Cetobacterium colombiensis TaxID=3073100 RepID=A0ABU4W6A4_9FUSO|nr:alanine racemase [Candidatus Cetobacterium colombiensis]MDX8335051.1 alanine racemase [Candidatus Cetobacterium colombiensis]